MIDISAETIAILDVARLQALVGLLEGGAVVCYSAPRPAPGGAPSEPLLARIPFAAGVGTIAGGMLIIASPIEGQVVQSGAIAWARVESGAGAWVADCNAADLELDRAEVIAGGFVRLLEASFA